MIGPAGENRVLLARDRERSGPLHARGGVGAVMGSKNLKAITARGSTPSEATRQGDAGIRRLRGAQEAELFPLTSQGLPEFGTAVLVNLMNDWRLPHPQFPAKQFQQADAISGEALPSVSDQNGACWGCPIGCAGTQRPPG